MLHTRTMLRLLLGGKMSCILNAACSLAVGRRGVFEDK